MVERLIVLDSLVDHQFRGPSFFPAGYASLPLHRDLSAAWITVGAFVARNYTSVGTLIAAIAKRLAIDEMRAIADSLNRCALSPASHGLVASKKDFKKIVGFGNILDYWSGYNLAVSALTKAASISGDVGTSARDFGAGFVSSFMP